MRKSLGSRGYVAWALAIATVSTGGCGSATLKADAGGHAGSMDAGQAAGATGTAGTTGTAGATGTAGTTGAGGATPDAGPVDTGAGSADALPACAGTTCSVTFASDVTWPAYDADPATPAAHSLGFARTVCLNSTSPPSCPGGALLYGDNATGWSFSLASIPGAIWVWAPGIVPTDVSDLYKVYLSRTFSVGLAPTGQINIAADDSARVLVNGTDVGGVGSISDVNQAGISNTRLTTIDLSVALHPGTNTITIAAQNGPASFAGCTGSCTYLMNPAGVVFGGTLSYH
jgi:hypothetical protein